MLVRDISVDSAILDLIDNSVDATQNKAGDAESLEPFHIDVTLDPDHFSISDNGCGIPVETAQNNAFRFGRPLGFNPDTRIGEFGIGMKRAVFRLGKHFIVDSSTAHERFVVDVDVEEWKNLEESEWTFPMDVHEPLADESGTTVEVRNLHEGVQSQFATADEVSRMLDEVADRHSEAINRGLQITFNKEPADRRLHRLAASSAVVPEYQRQTLYASDGIPVELRIIAGIGPERRSVAESGWYVYCNGRLVLKADRTSLTGWGTGEADGSTGTPAWHPQYQRFRGFVFFTADLPGALPWTTTKDEVDVSSPVYVNALARMRSIIRRYTTYTNALRLERDFYNETEGEAKQNIVDAVKAARLTELTSLREHIFTVPERDPNAYPTVPEGPETTRTTFYPLLSEMQALLRVLKMKTNRQVAEEAFERLYSDEIDEV